MGMAIVARPGQTAISQRPALQRIDWLLGLLTVLAEARGADVSAEGLELYAATLISYPDEDVRAVIERSARTKRAEGEKAWPALGDLLDPLERLQDRRREQQKQERARQADIELFWKVAQERIEERGVFRYNSVDYRSLDEVNQAPTTYKGTKPREQ